MDTYARMQAFVAVVEAGGFSAAARRTGRSKALLSKHVAELEEHLAVRLVNRTTRRIALTEAGEAYFQEAADILQKVADLEASVQDLQRGVRGRLRIAGPRTLGDELIAGIVMDFLQREPLVTVELTLEDRFVDVVEEGFDLAIRFADLGDSSLVARRLGSFRVVVCAAPALIASTGAPRHPDEFANLPCLIDSNARVQGNWPFLVDDVRRTVPVSGRARLNSPQAARIGALAGLGFTRIPYMLVRDDIRAGRLVVVLEAFHPPPAAIHAVYPHRRHLSRKVRVFLDYLVERFRQASEEGLLA